MWIIIYVLNVVASEPCNDTSGNNNSGASGSGRASTINYKGKIIKAPHDDNKLEIKCQSLASIYVYYI